jgi:hypothetical protein
MRRALVGALSVFVVAIAATSFGGCADGSDAPPYDELLLRDALRADPRSIESVPAPMKKTLGERLEREGTTTTTTTTQTTQTTQTTTKTAKTASSMTTSYELDAQGDRLSAQEIALKIDEQRAAKSEDALVVSVIEDSTQKIVKARALRIEKASATGADDKDLPPLPAIEGEPAPEGTRDAEARALGGRAGKTLRAILADTKASRVVRISGWPVGAVVIDDTLYVNGSWLVAMAALESGNSAAAAPSPPALVPITRPATLRGNPYATYTTLASCVEDISARCEGCKTNGVCGDAPTLDFPDQRSECVFLTEEAGNKKRIEQLCILALTSISTVSACVMADGCIPPSTANTKGSLPAADAFLAKEACVRSLNLCLSGKNEQKDAPSNNDANDVKVEGCSDPFKSCSSFFAGCTKACDQGKCSGSNSGPSCKSCDGCSNKGCTSCSGCSSDSRQGDGTGYGSEGTGQNPNASSSSSSSSSGSTSGSTGGTSSSSGSTGGTSSSSGSTGGTSASSSSGSTSSGGTSASSSSSGSSGSSSSSSSSSSSGCGSKSSSSSSGSGCSNGGCNNCKCSSSSSSSGSGGNCKCEEASMNGEGVPIVVALPPLPQAAKDAEEPSPLGPMSGYAWLLAPVVFLAKRARKQKEAVL